ncbi:MAG: Hsp20/alpha crystallin family protein [Armatimonadetes bacterium]|nr:Hsp20/alpha crystallin family protein [Armatimonadota bacterium]
MARAKTLAKKESQEMRRWDPWDTFEEMERMFRDFFTSPFPLLRPWRLRPSQVEFTPEVDLRETDKEFIFSATLPGMEKEDIDIDVTADRITISGERKAEEERPDECYHIRQQSYGAFNVSYGLPAEIKPDQVKATYKNGVLEVVMPKAEVREAKKVKIEG